MGLLQAVKNGKPFRRDPAASKAQFQTKLLNIVATRPKGRTTFDVGGGRGENSTVGIKSFCRLLDRLMRKNPLNIFFYFFFVDFFGDGYFLDQ